MPRDPVFLEVKQDIEPNEPGSPPRLVLRLMGALDIGTVGIFRESVEPHIKPGVQIVVDLSELTFCDSTGLGAIVLLYRQAVAADAVMVLRSPVHRVAAVLSMTGIDQVVTVIDAPRRA